MLELDKVTLYSRLVEKLTPDVNAEQGIRQVFNAHYSKVQPTSVNNPELRAWSDDLAQQFSLKRPERSGPAVDILAGNRVTPEMNPFAACYGGHQFGVWAGQLGDGRAIGLGELKDNGGKLWELQLKGAGPTPYSRGADGRAVLRSSLREFIASEAMFALGVPTTRALSLVTTGDKVVRDMFYDGNPVEEEGAIVARVAPSFLRFGNFEILASRRDTQNLHKLLDFVLEEYFPHLGASSPESILEFFRELCERTAFMISEWMRVGFVHGVMNTDNMSILGLTIDYGPYGFMDLYDPRFTPNTTDFREYRYCYVRQPSIGLWNLRCLADVLLPIVKNEEAIKACFAHYQDSYQKYYFAMRARKLGLRPRLGSVEVLNELAPLDQRLEQLLTDARFDGTLFFRKLWELRKLGVSRASDVDLQEFEKLSYLGALPAPVRESLGEFLKTYFGLLSADGRGGSDGKTGFDSEPSADEAALILKDMQLANPLYLPRNYLLQTAIERLEVGDESYLLKLQNVLRNPYNEQVGMDEFAAKRPEWAENKAGCSALSCSS